MDGQITVTVPCCALCASHSKNTAFIGDRHFLGTQHLFEWCIACKWSVMVQPRYWFRDSRLSRVQVSLNLCVNSQPDSHLSVQWHHEPHTHKHAVLTVIYQANRDKLVAPLVALTGRWDCCKVLQPILHSLISSIMAKGFWYKVFTGWMPLLLLKAFQSFQGKNGIVNPGVNLRLMLFTDRHLFVWCQCDRSMFSEQVFHSKWFFTVNDFMC